MNKVISANLETNPHNNSGSCLALYFKKKPTEWDVTAAALAERGKHAISLCDMRAEYEIVPSKLSEHTGLVRVLVYNVG